MEPNRPDLSENAPPERSATPLEFIAPETLTLDEVVAYWAEKRPYDIALEYFGSAGSERITWNQLENLVGCMAADLPQHLTAGSSVAVVCDDGVHFHVLLNALWRRGLAVLLLDRSWGGPLVQDLFELAACEVLFAKGWPVVLSDTITRAEYPVLRAAHAAPLRQRNDLNAIALFATTSGTTDNPKCVAISHRRIRTAYRTCFYVHDFSAIRKAAAIFHVNSLGILGVCFLLPREVGAGTRVFPPFSISNIVNVWRGVLNSSVDFVYVVPPVVRLLNTLPSQKVGRSIPLHAFCAAAPVRLEELRRLEEKFPLRVYNSYGLTELTFAVFFGCRAEDGRASDSIGFPVRIDAKIEDEQGNIVTGPGTGELLLKGPMLTDGYLKNSSGTAESWQDGWLRTGDVAERDDQGRYFIRGRKKDTVLRGGVTYYLHELEHYLRRAPAVIDVCAFKGRDVPSGDELCVVAQTERPVSEAELKSWIRQQMGSSKVPNVLIVTSDPLPRNSNGKVHRSVLQRRYLEGVLTATSGVHGVSK